MSRAKVKQNARLSSVVVDEISSDASRYCINRSFFSAGTRMERPPGMGEAIGGSETVESTVDARVSRDELPEPYWRWLEVQIPAIAAASKCNKRQGRWYRKDDTDGGKKKLKKDWFTLQWTMDNVPMIPDGLW